MGQREDGPRQRRVEGQGLGWGNKLLWAQVKVSFCDPWNCPKVLPRGGSELPVMGSFQAEAPERADIAGGTVVPLGPVHPQIRASFSQTCLKFSQLLYYL